MNLIIMSNICDYSSVLRTLKVLYYILMIIKVVLPIVLIISGIVIYAKATMNGTEEEIKKATSLFFKKLVSGLLVYIIPTFITALIGVLNAEYKSLSVNYGSCNVCLSMPEQCTYLIEAAELGEKEARELEAKAQAKQNSEAQTDKKEKDELYNKSVEGYKDNQKEKYNQNNNQNNSNNNSSYSGNESYNKNGIILDWNDITKTSNITASQLTAALQNCTQFGGKASRFVPYVSDLINAEKTHHVNLFYLIGLYALESGWLGSNYSVNCNNIGGVKYVSSKEGTVKGYGRCGSSEFARFDTIGDFIDFHANLLEKSYLTPGGSYYEGVTPEAVVIHYCPGGGTEYTDTVKSIGNGIYNAIP